MTGRLFMIRASVVFSLALVPACVAIDRPCGNTDAQRAEAEADTFRSWDALYKSFTSYRQCDDAAIAEGYSESVARILVDHWNTLPRLVQFERKDPAFRHFVLKHIDETLDAQDLKKISANATARCPARLNMLCRALRKKAEIP